METKRQNTRLFYGLIAGLAMIATTVVLYLGGLNVYMSGYGVVAYLLIITSSVLAVRKQKKDNGGWLEFQEALKISFSVLVIALLAQTVFSYFLMNYFDVSFKNAVKQATLEKTEQLLIRFKVPTDQVDKAIDDERLKDEYSFRYTSLGFALSCIWAFVIALIISGVMKKKKPEFPSA